MKSKKSLRRLISFTIALLFLFQCTLGVYAEGIGKDKAANKAAQLVKREAPKPAAIKTERPHKLPPGLMKKEDAFDKWKGKKEIIEDRTENSKTYQNDDGTYTTAVFTSPIHIKDKKGNLVNIDNTLVLVNSLKYSHKNKLGAFDAFFVGENEKNGGIKLRRTTYPLK